MVMFGDGSVAQVLLSAGQTTSPGKSGSGPYQSISWGLERTFLIDVMQVLTCALAGDLVSCWAFM